MVALRFLFLITARNIVIKIITNIDMVILDQGWAKISFSFSLFSSFLGLSFSFRTFLHENDTKIKFQKILFEYSKTSTQAVPDLKPLWQSQLFEPRVISPDFTFWFPFVKQLQAIPRAQTTLTEQIQHKNDLLKSRYGSHRCLSPESFPLISPSDSLS